MRTIRTTPVAALVTAIALATVLRGQDAIPGRTEWGDPDLEGTWVVANTLETPLQRPIDGDDASLLRELIDAGALEFGLINEGVPEAPRIEQRQWALTDWRRSHPLVLSLIVEPPGGRIPPMTDAATARAASQWRSSSQTKGPWNSAADLAPAERCISRGALGSMFPSFDYHGLQIVQAPGVVVLRNEMIHESRILPLDDRPALSAAIRTYMGDSRARWDGDTLVVETTNFNGRTGAHLGGNETPTSERLRLVERFARVDEDTIDYEVLVDDPDTWAAPWKAAYPITRQADYVMSEYACHEGNYAMRNILSAARAAERTGRR